ncbi:MAG: P-II family nitrogen regulator [Lachnospiraceae bacterium]|nr:P-II family nitrogen regulator [Lachnospiraceae bacterium]
MELYYVIAVLERSRERQLVSLYREQNVPLILTALGHGTATNELLDIHGLRATAKAIIFTVTDAEQTKQLFTSAKRKLMIDIPGNGVMLSIPVKSVGGSRTLAFFTNNNETANKGTPNMQFAYEMIMVILNQGYTDVVMDAARAAGAQGGTVIHAKGTGTELSKKFLDVSIATEKEIILIASVANKKADIMRSIMEHAGPDTPSGAVTFSLPVSAIEGVRRIEEV